MSEQRAARVRKAQGPSLALSLIFVLAMTALVVPLVGFVAAFSAGSQAALDLFTGILKWALVGVGLVMLYGFAVGVWHTFLAFTGLDRGRKK